MRAPEPVSPAPPYNPTPASLRRGFCGSSVVGTSPQLFAAIRVLRRLAAPRHPPWTLFHLTILSFQLPSLTNLKKPLEAQGLEPWTLGLQSRCSSQLSHAPVSMSDRKERDPRPAYKPFTSAGPSPARGNAPSLPHGCEPMGLAFLLRKEVIQPHLPVRLPCYDFTPLTRFTLGTAPLSVRLATSGTPGSDGVTGGVYKARERIHRAMLMRDY